MRGSKPDPEGSCAGPHTAPAQVAGADASAYVARSSPCSTESFRIRPICKRRPLAGEAIIQHCKPRFPEEPGTQEKRRLSV
jgi:hypothetical protein